MTKKTYETVMDIIGSFLEEQGDSIKNTYYAMKKVTDSYEKPCCVEVRAVRPMRFLPD